MIWIKYETWFPDLSILLHKKELWENVVTSIKMSTKHPINSFLFVEYQFLWFSVVQTNHEIKSTWKAEITREVISKFQIHEFKY
jgi:hypothetical protein